MKKALLFVLAAALLLSLCACAQVRQLVSETAEQAAEVQQAQTEQQTQVIPQQVIIKPSPDKYTWYIKNYVGLNCAAFGYTSIGGERFDRYGSGLLELIFVADGGEYVDIEDDDALKQYVVTAQNLEPNTEMKFTYERDNEGNEYSNLLESQSFEQIVLRVKKVGAPDSALAPLTVINPAPDKYNRYIYDYVGRNLAACGYTSMGGDRMDEYGDSYVKLVLVSTDGAFIDPGDAQALQSYIVIGQDIAPNTVLSFTFLKDSDGKEYSNLVDTKSFEQIILTVQPLG